MIELFDWRNRKKNRDRDREKRNKNKNKNIIHYTKIIFFSNLSKATLHFSMHRMSQNNQLSTKKKKKTDKNLIE
jgi:hypothetical protein